MYVNGGALCLLQEEHFVCDRRSSLSMTGALCL